MSPDDDRSTRPDDDRTTSPDAAPSPATQERPEPVEGATAPPIPAAGYGFSAIVGQDTAVAALRQAMAARRLPHTLLFEGPVGVGKATCAGLLAQALNCPEQGPAGTGPAELAAAGSSPVEPVAAGTGPVDACGRCPSCRKIARGIHPDVTTLVPDEKGAIKIDVVREQVIAAVGFRPHEGRRRVVIIDDAQALTAEAQNALLKTLEEPPATVVIVLVTPVPRELLPTVRSRSQSLRFAPLPPAEVRRYLTGVLGMDEDEARLRASLVPGSLGSAIGLDLEAHLERRRVVEDGLRRVPRGGSELLAAADAMLGAGAGERDVDRAASSLSVARDVLRDLVVLDTRDDDALLINADRAGAWRAWASSLEVNALMDALAAVQRGLETVTGPITPNGRLALEHTLAEVGHALAADRRGSTANP